MAAHVLKLSHVRPVVVGILILIKDVEKEKFGSLILIYQDVILWSVVLCSLLQFLGVYYSLILLHFS